MILASSLDNFIILNNSHVVDKPYVTFTVGSPTNVNITIKDRDNEDGYNKVIVGSPTSVISSTSFKTTGVVALNLLECLKKNSIFYDVRLQAANTIICGIDSSISYSITTSGNGITVGGTYSSYNAVSINKMVVLMQGEIDNNTSSITMEKYNDTSSISFNVTSPFSQMGGKSPITIGITAYQVYNNESSLVTVPYSEATILPTTLSKFQSVDYDDYVYEGSKVHWLTNNEERYYNYGEHYGLSVLCNTLVGIKKNYYTNSGMFLESDTTFEYRERNGIRYDFYDTLDISGVESRYHHQVGYVLVYGMIGSLEITYPVRFNVRPRCKENNELFFVNELGGIDSFNFTNTKTIERKIDDLSTYKMNPIRPWGDTYEIQHVKGKNNKITKILSTNQLNNDTAEWLNELNKSRYVFKYLGASNPRFMVVIVDKFDIETNSDTSEFELELEYHDSDNDV